MPIPAPPEGFSLIQSTPTPPPGFTLLEDPSTPPENAPEEVKLSFAQRAGKVLFDRQKMAEEIMRATGEGEQTTAEGVLQVAGKVGFGGALELMGEGLVSAARGVSAIVPDVIEDPVVDSAKRTAQRLFLNTVPGRAGLEMATQGMEAYEEFAEENPRAARNIEAVVDIALLAAPVGSRASSKPVSQTTRLGEAANVVEAAGARQVAQNRNDFIEGLIRPKQTKGVREDQVARSSEGGLLRSRTIAPSAREAEIAAVVSEIPAVTRRNTLQGNYNAIRRELSEEAGRLGAILESSPAQISRSEVKKSLDLARQRLQQSPTIVGDAAKSAERLINVAQRIVADNAATSAGLLRARQQFDKFVASQKPKAFDPAIENATSIALRDVRQTLNNLIDTKNPTQGVRQSLTRQMNMYRAMDNIAPKAADEYSNALLRGWQNAMRVLPFRGEFNQMMATAFGVGGLGASAQFAPMFTSLALGGVGTYVAGKFILGPAVKKGVSVLLRQIDDALKVATDPAMIKQLRLDRALIMQLTKGTE